MARRRMIDPNIWQSEDFSTLSLLAKLVFIGMFSLADDEGKGRAKPNYLKSVIFPYDDGMRLIDIEKALSEIGHKMSVTFYAHDEKDYYSMDNWGKWQRVDKPTPSKIPNPELLQSYSGITPESFRNDSSPKEKKRKEYKDNPPLSPQEGEGLSDPVTKSIDEWMRYKTERKNFYADTGRSKLIAQIKNMVSKNGEDAVIRAIDESMANNWQGIIWAKIEKQTVADKTRDPITGIRFVN